MQAEHGAGRLARGEERIPLAAVDARQPEVRGDLREADGPHAARRVALDLGRRELRIPERDDAQRHEPPVARAAPLLDHPVVVRADAEQRELAVAWPRGTSARRSAGSWGTTATPASSSCPCRAAARPGRSSRAGRLRRWSRSSSSRRAVGPRPSPRASARRTGLRRPSSRRAGRRCPDARRSGARPTTPARRPATARRGPTSRYAPAGATPTATAVRSRGRRRSRSTAHRRGGRWVRSFSGAIAVYLSRVVAGSVLPVDAVGARRLTADPQRAQRRVDHRDAVPLRRVETPPPLRESRSPSPSAHCCHVGIAQSSTASSSFTIAVVNAPNSSQPWRACSSDASRARSSRSAAVPGSTVTSSCAYTSPRTPSAQSSSIVRVHGAGTTMRSKPPLRNSAALAHHRSSAGSCAPRPTASVANDAARPDQPVVLPHVHRLRPRAGRADQRPHAVAELIALLLADRAPVRGHVLHVVRAVVPDDVDELVDVDAVVHGFVSLSVERFGQQLPRVAFGVGDHRQCARSRVVRRGDAARPVPASTAAASASTSSSCSSSSAAYLHPPGRNHGSTVVDRGRPRRGEEDLEPGGAAPELAHRADVELAAIDDHEAHDARVEVAQRLLVAPDESGFECDGHSGRRIHLDLSGLQSAPREKGLIALAPSRRVGSIDGRGPAGEHDAVATRSRQLAAGLAAWALFAATAPPSPTSVPPTAAWRTTRCCSASTVKPSSPGSRRHPTRPTRRSPPSTSRSSAA